MEYEGWCASPEPASLPVKVEDVTSYLLCLREGVPKHELTMRAYGLERIHVLADHPPRQLAKQVLSNLLRALQVPSWVSNVMGMVEDREQQAARKALEMFPSGDVPKRYPANV